MAILKSTKAEEILDLLSAYDVSVRELLTEMLPNEDADEYVLGLLPATLLNAILVELRQRSQAQAKAS